MRHIEIEQVAKFESTETEIAQHLAATDRENRFNRFQLDHDAIVHEKVDPISVLDHEIVITNRDRYLLAHCHGTLFQFVRKSKHSSPALRRDPHIEIIAPDLEPAGPAASQFLEVASQNREVERGSVQGARARRKTCRGACRGGRASRACPSPRFPDDWK